MDDVGLTCLENRPDPMWIHDLETQRFLDVNDAAIRTYGHSRAEFLEMAIGDLLADPAVAVTPEPNATDEPGPSRHRLKSGAIINVSVTTRVIDYDGRKAMLVVARDVSRPVVEHRSAGDTDSGHFKSILESLPGMFVVVTVDQFVMVAASDSYVAAAHKMRADLIGRPLFEVFPEDPKDSTIDGVGKLTESFRKVIASGIPDVMPMLVYPVRIPGQGNEENFETRYASVVNSPIRGDDGQVAYIIHRAEEVTEQFRLADSLGLEPAALSDSDSPVARLAHELMRRTEELKHANDRRQFKAARLRTVQRLLKIGYLQVNATTGTAEWSDELCEIYGIAPEDFAKSQEAYFELIHPDDREVTAAVLQHGLQSGAKEIVFEHRIIRPQGGIIHVRGVAEVSRTPDGIIMTGVMQDITDQIRAAADLREAAAMAALAGRVAHIGGWRMDLNPTKIHWSDEVAAIHDEPAGTSPELDVAVNYYPPGYREVIQAAVSDCIALAKPFDQVLQIVTAQNRRVWVRAIGEPELGADGSVVAMRGAFQDISEIMDIHDASNAIARRLAQILENMGESFIVLDSEWRFAFVNVQAERLLKRNRADLIGKVCWDEFPAARGSRLQDEFERAVSTGRPIQFKFFYAEPLNLWLGINAQPTPDGLAVYFRDVTAEHQNMEQLRLLELSVSHLNDMLLITEAKPIDPPDGPKIVYVNNAVVQKTGYSRSELLGATPRLLQGELTQRPEMDRIRTAMVEGKPVRAELVNYTRDQQEYWVEISINPVADEAGHISHLVSVQRDITERKTAETALRLSEERFRLMSNAFPSVIWDWDLVAGTVWCNDNMEKLFGYPAGTTEVTERNWSERIHPDDLDQVNADLAAMIESGSNVWQGEHRYIKANRDVAIVLSRGYFIRDADGKPLRMIGSMVDITKDNENEARRRQSQKLEAMGQLTGGVAHDFNNLLTVILGSSEIIAERTTDPSLKQLADVALGAADRGAALTHRLLAFARQQPLHPKIVDINALIASIEGMLQRTLPENVELLLKLSHGLWLVELDANQLEVALLNLAINARDAMPRGGKLTVNTANTHVDEANTALHTDVAPGSYVQITVTDGGTGMTPEVLSRAFEPFFTTKPEGSGSGLGLSMVYGFVKQSGGQIKIRSEVGQGTAFSLYFPRNVSGETVIAPFRAENPEQGGRERILVVEDDDLVREHLVGQLRDMGYQVVHAPNALSGLEILATQPGIDMLLTDVIMPGGINGWQLSEIACKQVPGLKVLFTSGYSDNSLGHNGRLDPGVELLNKPFRKQELAAKVRKVLEK
jgi:PAS domain S-box-containing protein